VISTPLRPHLPSDAFENGLLPVLLLVGYAQTDVICERRPFADSIKERT